MNKEKSKGANLEFLAGKSAGKDGASRWMRREPFSFLGKPAAGPSRVIRDRKKGGFSYFFTTLKTALESSLSSESTPPPADEGMSRKMSAS